MGAQSSSLRSCRIEQKMTDSGTAHQGAVNPTLTFLFGARFVNLGQRLHRGTGHAGKFHTSFPLVSAGPTAAPRPRRATVQKSSVSGGFGLERVMGIEPTSSAWKAAALPLSYTRSSPHSCRYRTCRTVAASQPAGGGGSWIRNNVGIANGFTARPL